MASNYDKPQAGRIYALTGPISINEGQSWEDSEVISDPRCPMCDSDQSAPMGQLGNVFWLRCRRCGYDHPRSEPDDNKPKEK